MICIQWSDTGRNGDRLFWKAGSTTDCSVWEEKEEHEILVPVIQVTSSQSTTGHAGSFAEGAATYNSCGTPKQEPGKCYNVPSLSVMKQTRRSLANVCVIEHSHVAGRKINIKTCTAPHNWPADCQGQV
jgi:hypothetical protein